MKSPRRMKVWVVVDAKGNPKDEYLSESLAVYRAGRFATVFELEGEKLVRYELVPVEPKAKKK